MSTYTNLSESKVQGKLSSRVQGDMMGSASTMPTASSQNLGCVVLYTGTTDANYTNGQYYICTVDDNVYSWTAYTPAGGITVDDALSNVSENPVQNKVITGAINDLDTALDSKFGTAGTDLEKDSQDDTKINHSASGVGSNYENAYLGDATHIPKLKMNAQGHVTAVDTATVYPPTTAGIQGQVWKSNGSGAGSWADPSTLATGSVSPSNTGLVNGGQVATAISSALASVYVYKGTYQTYQALNDAVSAGTIVPSVGWVFNIETAGGTDAHGNPIDAGDNVACLSYNSGTKVATWDVLGGTVDLSNYATLTKLGDGSVTKLGTSTIGSKTSGQAQAIYWNAGVPSAIDTSVGSATEPIYMDSGVFKGTGYIITPSTTPLEDNDTHVPTSKSVLSAINTCAKLSAGTDSNPQEFTGFTSFNNNNRFKGATGTQPIIIRSTDITYNSQTPPSSNQYMPVLSWRDANDSIVTGLRTKYDVHGRCCIQAREVKSDGSSVWGKLVNEDADNTFTGINTFSNENNPTQIIQTTGANKYINSGAETDVKILSFKDAQGNEVAWFTLYFNPSGGVRLIASCLNKDKTTTSATVLVESS